MYTCSAKYYVDTKRKRKLCKMLRKHKIVQPKYWLSLIRWQWSTCTICLNLNSCSASAVIKTMTTIWNIRTDSFTGCCTIWSILHFPYILNACTVKSLHFISLVHIQMQILMSAYFTESPENSLRNCYKQQLLLKWQTHKILPSIDV